MNNSALLLLSSMQLFPTIILKDKSINQRKYLQKMNNLQKKKVSTKN